MLSEAGDIDRGSENASDSSTFASGRAFAARLRH